MAAKSHPVEVASMDAQRLARKEGRPASGDGQTPQPRAYRTTGEASGQQDSALSRWAQELGVAVDALERLGCVVGDAGDLQFPMKNSNGEVIGMRRRFQDGRKLTIEGGHNGLFIPDNLDGDGRLFIAEGPTDTAALLSMDLPSIGLPGAGQSVDLAVSFIRRLGVQDVVIVADADDAGRRGARKLAEALEGVCSVRICEPPEPHKDVRDWLKAEPLLREDNLLAQCIGLESERTEISAITTDWPDLLPFGVLHLPLFPLAVLPDPVRMYASAVAEALQVPPDLPAMLSLSIVGFVTTRLIRIPINRQWIEQPNLYTMIVLPPGERKSATLKVLAEALERWEAQENERLAPAVEQYRRQRDLIERRIESLKRKAAGADDAGGRRQLENELDAACNEIDGLEPVHPVRLLADDVTPERLTSLLSENGGRLAILSAEGDILDILAGRYSRDGRSNLGTVLKSYAGDTIRVDRTGRGPEYIKDPALSLGLIVQPDVLQSLTRDRAFRGRGLLGRFCYSLPRTRLGERTIHGGEVPADVSAGFERIVRTILNTPLPSDGLHEVTLSPDAMDLLNTFRGDTEGRLAADGDLRPIADWANRLPGMVIRIACIIEAMAEPGTITHRQVGPIAMAGAIEVGHYLSAHALAAYQEMRVTREHELAERVAEWLTTRTEGVVTKRDIHRRLGSSIETVDDLEPVIEVLVTRGYLRPVVEQHEGRGRPSERYEVNPDVL